MSQEGGVLLRLSYRVLNGLIRARAIVACGDCALILIGAMAATIFIGAATQAADAPFHDKPVSARSLPADNLPPFRMLDDSGHLVPIPDLPPGALHRGAGSPPESTALGPSLAASIQAAERAVKSCGTAGYRVGVAVIDSAGEARAMLTADGSDGSHVFVAMRKALTALAFETPSSQAAEAVQKDHALLSKVKPNMFVMAGAVPIVKKGVTIGAIGVSGAGGMPFGHQDEACAIEALRNLQGLRK